MTGDDLFTLEFAERQLPKISPFLLEAQRLRREIAREVLRQPHLDGGMNSPMLDRKIQRLCECLEHIESLGGFLKDLDRGIIDFPALFEDREVFFCWLHGEPCIRRWHECYQICTGRGHRVLDLDCDFPEGFSWTR